MRGIVSWGAYLPYRRLDRSQITAVPRTGRRAGHPHRRLVRRGRHHHGRRGVPAGPEGHRRHPGLGDVRHRGDSLRRQDQRHDRARRPAAARLRAGLRPRRLGALGGRRAAVRPHRRRHHARGRRRPAHRPGRLGRRGRRRRCRRRPARGRRRRRGRRVPRRGLGHRGVPRPLAHRPARSGPRSGTTSSPSSPTSASAARRSRRASPPPAWPPPTSTPWPSPPPPPASARPWPASSVSSASHPTSPTSSAPPAPPSPALLLAGMLEAAEPDQVLALVVLADGAEVLFFRTTPALAVVRPSGRWPARSRVAHPSPTTASSRGGA